MRNKESLNASEYGGLLSQLNDETRNHSKRVAKICAALAPALSLDEEIAFKIGFLHDVGKIYTPQRIIRKKYGLSPLEREIIDLHAYFGYKILKERNESPTIYMPVLFHHGYWKPKLFIADEELMDEETVRYVYLVHSADVFDAITSKRSYREALPKEIAIKALSSDMLSTPMIVGILDDVGERYIENTGGAFS